MRADDARRKWQTIMMVTTMNAMVLHRCAPIEKRPLKLKSMPIPKPKKIDEPLLKKRHAECVDKICI
jgi:hypothetical protein